MRSQKKEQDKLLAQARKESNTCKENVDRLNTQVSILRAALSSPSAHASDLASREKEPTKERELEKEIYQLEYLLNGAWVRLTTGYPPRYARPVAGVQHDQLLQSFRRLRNQEFRSLGEALSRFMKTKQGVQDDQDLQFILTKGILAAGNQLLLRQLIEAYGTAGPLGGPEFIAAQNAITHKVRDALQISLGIHLSDDLDRHLVNVVGEAMNFLKHLLTSTPPGMLWFAEKDLTFNPTFHETWDRSTPAEGAPIRRTIFPGYFVHDPPNGQVAEKAQVETLRAGSDNQAFGHREQVLTISRRVLEEGRAE
jgi:hypothetical protein